MKPLALLTILALPVAVCPVLPHFDLATYTYETARDSGHSELKATLAYYVTATLLSYVQCEPANYETIMKLSLIDRAIERTWGGQPVTQLTSVPKIDTEAQKKIDVLKFAGIEALKKQPLVMPKNIEQLKKELHGTLTYIVQEHTGTTKDVSAVVGQVVENAVRGLPDMVAQLNGPFIQGFKA